MAYAYSAGPSAPALTKGGWHCVCVRQRSCYRRSADGANGETHSGPLDYT